MTSAISDRVEWLREAVHTGAIHTVRASFTDRLGHWRGKRIPADHFMEHLEQTIGFCDGMLVCDVRCDVIEETPYSNYGTGYPDFNVRFDLERLRPVGWMAGEAYVFGDPYDHDGEPSQVSPRNVLRRVVGRLASRGIKARVGFSLGGRFMHDPDRPALIPPGGLDPGDDELGALTRIGGGLQASEIEVRAIESGLEPGAFRVTMTADEPMAAAEAAVVAKGAAKEIARQLGVTASFMTMQRHAKMPSVLEPVVELAIPSTMLSDPSRIRMRLSEVRALIQPSVNAFKIGPPPLPTLEATSYGVRVGDLVASSEADPFTVAAALLAAIAADSVRDGGSVDSQQELMTLEVATTKLTQSTWAADWLGTDFVANSVPLLEREGRLLRSAVTDWEIDRYWGTA